MKTKVRLIKGCQDAKKKKNYLYVFLEERECSSKGVMAGTRG